jgi:hypothetical protein
VPPFPETMSYVKRVKHIYDQQKLPPAAPAAPKVNSPT